MGSLSRRSRCLFCGPGRDRYPGSRSERGGRLVRPRLAGARTGGREHRGAGDRRALLSGCFGRLVDHALGGGRGLAVGRAEADVVGRSVDRLPVVHGAAALPLRALAEFAAAGIAPRS